MTTKNNLQPIIFAVRYLLVPRQAEEIPRSCQGFRPMSDGICIILHAARSVVK
jgi:hypothetical protein